MGGRETVKDVLKIDPKAKNIVAGGYSNDPIMTSFQEYGFDAAISKPFCYMDLPGAIRRISD